MAGFSLLIEEVVRAAWRGKGMRDTEVDHFLPWSHHPRDLGHNFVLAHAECKAKKRDHLASLEHLVHWFRRNDEQGAQMAGSFNRAGLPHDLPTLRRVTHALYGVAENAGAQVWRKGSEFVALDAGWRRVIEPG